MIKQDQIDLFTEQLNALEFRAIQAQSKEQTRQIAAEVDVLVKSVAAAVE